MQKKYRIGLHVLVWTFLFLNSFLPHYLDNSYRLYASKPGTELFVNYFLISLGYFICDIISFYFAATVIAPLFLKHKKWVKGSLAVLILFAFIPTYRYLLEYHFFIPLLGFDNYNGKTPTVAWYIKNSISYTFFRHFIYGLVYFIIAEWFNHTRKQKELEKEKIAAELAFLKSQINPHFLFNTLNDIYALTYRQSAQAPHAVLKLSELLRYMLKESDGKFTDLQNEIDYLKNVIELHKIGQKEVAYIDFEIEGDVDKQQIAPLILINFVENAFKHGVIDNPSYPIKIKLEINDRQLIFTVSNLKNQDYKDITGGIGLTNVRRRLDLIYPGKHALQIEEKEDTFIVSLKIEWI